VAWLTSQWLLLNHAHNSPLSALAADEDATAYVED
jgi:hypothetical protein